MTFDEYEQAAISTAVYPGRGDNLYYPALGAAGEAGEIANKVKKVMRDHNGVLSEETRTAIADEIGDLLWYAAALAHELETSLDDCAARNVAKLQSRRERGTLQGNGDNR